MLQESMSKLEGITLCITVKIRDPIINASFFFGGGGWGHAIGCTATEILKENKVCFMEKFILHIPLIVHFVLSCHGQPYSNPHFATTTTISSRLRGGW